MAGAEGYMTASTYPDDGVGEVFLKLGKQGSTLAGVMDAFSVAISVGLQYGIPLESFVAKFTNMRFEPAGMTDDPDIRIATSVMDYIFRRLALDHLPYEERADLGILSAAERAAQLAGQDPAAMGEDVDPVELAQSAAVEKDIHSERARGVSQPDPAQPPSPAPSAPARRPGAERRASRREHAGPAQRPRRPAQHRRADRVAAGPHGRRPALPHLRHEDAPGRQLLRLRRLRLHQRLQLRHHRHRARPRARQVQEAGRRRVHADRQPDRPPRLKNLGYQPEQIEAITEYIAEHGHVVNAPGLKPEHYEVFDCAMGERSIGPMGHVRMMAAVQPMLSGSISKTVNMPESATVEEVEKIYFEGWKLGLKALAIYRDNCKVGQPLSVARRRTSPPRRRSRPRRPRRPSRRRSDENRPVRRRLPKTRSATVTRFDVAGAEGYMTASTYPDDGVGEVFLKLGKQGSTLAGVMDAFSVAISVGLQYGIPLESFVAKFTNMRFEPAGMTDDPDIRIATSVMDYIFRRLALDHLPYEERADLGILSAAERAAQLAGQDPAAMGEDVDPVELAQSAAVEKDIHSERARGVSQPDPAQPPSPAPSAPADPAPGAAPAAPSAPVQPSAPAAPHSTAELIESQQGRTADAPLCLTCGTKMRPAGSCYVCEGCGSTSGCS